ncbi:hypothetical protein BH23CHL4_BH23CHL4_21500 [soil metagenome]
MHPVQATDAIHWAERRHQEQLAQAERDRLASKLRQSTRMEPTANGLVAHPMRLATVLILLILFLAVAAI